jgi:hypothetical protein
MHIVEDEMPRLVLRDRTLWISFVCAGAAAFMGIGVIVAHKNPAGLLASAFLLMGAVAFLRSSDIILDASRRVCSIRRRDMLRVTHREIGFDEIRDVTVDLQADTVHKDVFTYRLGLLTDEGPVPFGGVFEGGGPERCHALRETLVRMIFAGRPAPSVADPVRTLVAAGRTLDAVALLRSRDGLALADARAKAEEIRKAIAA